MKKFLIAILIILLILTGIFIWKGGHHALALSGMTSDWLNSDSAAQSLNIEYNHQSFTVNSETGQLKQKSSQWELSADSFWTEHEGQRIFGLTAEGISAYTDRQNLYLESGKAYALPELPDMEKTLKRLSTGLLLYGRVTKNGDTYKITMKTKELDLTASITAENTITNVTVQAILPEGTTINGSITAKEAPPAPIPQAVADAITRAKKQPPMSLTEPMESLLPAIEGLLPLTADLKLTVSCGILQVSETVQLTVRSSQAMLTRGGMSLELALPKTIHDLHPLALAMLILQEGEFARMDDGALFTLSLPSETATELLGSLVPQAADLGITLGDSSLRLCITADRLTSASMSAEGSVPFLFTTIPVDFSAELTRQ